VYQCHTVMMNARPQKWERPRPPKRERPFNREPGASRGLTPPPLQGYALVCRPKNVGRPYSYPRSSASQIADGRLGFVIRRISSLTHGRTIGDSVQDVRKAGERAPHSTAPKPDRPPEPTRHKRVWQRVLCNQRSEWGAKKKMPKQLRSSWLIRTVYGRSAKTPLASPPKGCSAVKQVCLICRAVKCDQRAPWFFSRVCPKCAGQDERGKS
jgi:hypothetical protein